MAEFIGSRISLISKRDIRYVGTLHEISSENSTVALEQVISFGTEGRRTDDYVAPSENVYEYIVFRGSDVKDLRIEEGPKENNPPPKPSVPDDPAILGSARRPPPASNVQAPQGTAGSKSQVQQSQNQQPQKPVSQQQPQQRQQQPPPQYPQQSPYPYPYPPPNPRFGPQGFPPGPGFPGMPYAGPPGGWYPPPGYGYHHMPPNQFHPHQMPIGPPGQPPRQAAAEPPQTVPTPTGSAVNEATKPGHQANSPVKPTATVRLPSSSNTPIPLPTQQKGPPPPVESKPDVAAALAPPAPIAAQANASSASAVPTGLKSGRIVPAVPLSSPKIKTAAATNGAPKVASGDTVQSYSVQTQPEQPASKPAPVKAKTIEEANRDARAAVAAAMAKLPPAPGQKKPAEGTGAMDNLTRKVNEMRTHDDIRTSRQPGTGGYAAGNRGGERGNNRGNRRDHQGKKVEIPTTDYDFQSANEKFNKKDLVKEAIASGSPLATPVDETNGAASFPATNGDAEETVTKATHSTTTYNKSASFFDNISSESKDRTEGDRHRLGGREFRSEERQKNLETFGQGSVDNGYRGAYGRGGRGRSRGYGRGRGGMRGGYENRGARNGVRGSQGAVATEG